MRLEFTGHLTDLMDFCDICIWNDPVFPVTKETGKYRIRCYLDINIYIKRRVVKHNSEISDQRVA